MVATPPRSALEFYDVLHRQGVATSLLVSREWRSMNPRGDWAGQWAKLMPRVNLIVSAGRVGAAAMGGSSVAEMLAESGYPEPQDGRVNPSAFAGWAGSGVPMDKYLAKPVMVARQATGSPDEMLSAGGKWLDGLVRTAVTDAGRGGQGVAITATKNAGFIRYEPAPYCQRCAVLVGKFYRWNTGFQRHPRCEAIHIATSARQPEGERFHAEIDVSQIRDLTDAQRKAIEDGADVNRVINAYRAAKAGQRESMATTAELSRGGKRLTPEAIYSRAATREEAIRLLRLNAYLT